MVANGTDLQRPRRQAPAAGLEPPAAGAESSRGRSSGGKAAAAAHAASVSAGLEGGGSESCKWGAACLAVLPDAWLAEEGARRAHQRAAAGQPEQGGKEEDLAEALSASDPAVFVVAPPRGSKVQLCNTGKCEMFD